jgi:hypothetical protein
MPKPNAQTKPPEQPQYSMFQHQCHNINVATPIPPSKPPNRQKPQKSLTAKNPKNPQKFPTAKNFRAIKKSRQKFPRNKKPKLKK